MESALENVPKADTCALSEVCSAESSFVCAAPYAEVSEDTMALMSRPDPMPVEVMSELGEPEELAVLLFTAELMGAFC